MQVRVEKTNLIKLSTRDLELCAKMWKVFLFNNYEEMFALIISWMRMSLKNFQMRKTFSNILRILKATFCQIFFWQIDTFNMNGLHR